MWFKYGLKAQKLQKQHALKVQKLQKQHALKGQKLLAQGVWLGASALYLCFTLRPAIFNSLRPVTVGSGRVELTCET